MLLNNLKIGTKLLVGFGCVLVLTIALGFISYNELKKNDDDYTNLIDNVISRSQAMTDIGWSFGRYRRIVLTAIINSGDKAVLDDLRVAYEYEKNDIKIQFRMFDNAAAADGTLSQAEKDELKKVSDEIEELIVNEYEPLVDRVFNFAYAGDYDSANNEVSTAQQIAATLDKELSDFIQQAKDNTAKMSNRSTQMAARSEMLVVIILIATVILGLLIAYLIAKLITSGVNGVTEAAGKISNGDFDVAVGSNNKDEIATLSNSLLNVKTTVQRLANDINKMAADFALGETDISIDTNSYEGEFKKIGESINKTVTDLLQDCLYAIGFVTEIGNGNFSLEVKKFPGKRGDITRSLNEVKNNLIRFNGDIVGIIEGASNGDLDVNIDGRLYKGDWNKMADGINGLLSAVVEPVREVIIVLNELAKGNLNASVDGRYNGEFAKMKDALNDTMITISSYIKEISDILGSMSNQDLTRHITRDYIGDFVEMRKSINTIVDVFNKLLYDISSSADQVAAGAAQISQSSMDLAQGTTEQASSIEELNATVEEISNQTKTDSENAKYASELALKAKSAAEAGSEEMSIMLRSMQDINNASNNISKIIKVIDDIAFQTNLLALNAAVEAARAGEHGKGFAVVAEEVRNLAGRSQSAAKETSSLIEGSVEKVAEGSSIADKTAQSFKTIVSEIVEIASLLETTAKTSERQAEALGQINIGVGQISAVTQTNSASSEEQASAAQELSSQADVFKSMVNKFKL